MILSPAEKELLLDVSEDAINFLHLLYDGREFSPDDMQAKSEALTKYQALRTQIEDCVPA